MFFSLYGLVGFRVIGGRLILLIKELVEELMLCIVLVKLGLMLVKYL